ncbi:MAG: hypothetical protein Q9200_007518, partial [Gallowayella weberi]
MKSWYATESKSCEASETWSRCFLRLSLGGPGSTCEQINDASCASIDVSRLDPAVQNQAAYVQYAITRVNGLFSSYDAVLQQTTNNIDPIMRAFNNDKPPPSVEVLERLLAYPLSLGLNVIAATQTATGPKTRSAARIWMDSLLAAPNVAIAIWPNSDLNQQQLDLTNLNLASRSNINAQLSRGLELLMSDLDTFLAFTGKGRFTSSENPSVPFTEAGANPAIAADTFLTSRLMEKSGFYAVPGPIVDAATFQTTNPSCRDTMATGTVCARPAPAGGFVYWSPTTHRTYELKTKKPPKNVPQMQ